MGSRKISMESLVKISLGRWQYKFYVFSVKIEDYKITEARRQNKNNNWKFYEANYTNRSKTYEQIC